MKLKHLSNLSYLCLLLFKIAVFVSITPVLFAQQSIVASFVESTFKFSHTVFEQPLWSAIDANLFV